MTGYTQGYGWPYPSRLDGPNPNQVRDLAEAVESTLATIDASIDGADVALDARIDALDVRTTDIETTLTDDGIQTLAVTAASGWTATATYRKWGFVLSTHLIFTRTGGTITGPSNGDVTNSTMGTITNTALRPAVPMWNFAAGGGSMGGCRINTDGVCLLFALHANASIANGSTCEVSATYLVP